MEKALLNMNALIDCEKTAGSHQKITQMSLNTQAYYYALIGEIEQSFKSYYKVLELAKEFYPNTEQHIISLVNVSATYHSTQQPHEALEFLMEGYGIATKNEGMEFFRRRIVQMMGEILSELGQHERAVEILSAELTGIEDDSEQAFMLLTRGNALAKLGRFSEALHDYEENIRLLRKIGWEEEIFRTLTNQAHCYSDMGLFEQSLSLSLQALEGRRKQGIPVDIAYSLSVSGWALHKNSKSNDALRLITEAKTLAKAQNASFLLAMIVEGEANILFELERFQKAASVYKEYLSLKSKNEKEQIGRQIAFANVKYGIERATADKREAEKVRDHALMELKSLSLRIIHTNEILHSVRKELEAILTKDAETKQNIKRISHSIEDTLQAEQHWTVFQTQFNVVHGDFIAFLSRTYRELSAIEMKICAFLRTGMSTKDIALLLNKSIRTIENQRNSIRKKMKLKPEDNLHILLQSIQD